jgi:hypothetical protein
MKQTMTTYLTLAEIAADIDVTVGSMRVYHQRALKNRRDNTTRPGDLPPADATFSRTPAWTRQTVDAWKLKRPGRGSGGGRKA